ncbi:MAG: helix-turn-helix domain-containing protein [Thermodesulfobacteriota bacterium]
MKYNLKNLIFKSGKSQWQICGEINWPEAKLSRFVTGRRVPSPDDLETLASVLAVSRQELQEALQ